jgi:hypothetical protein
VWFGFVRVFATAVPLITVLGVGHSNGTAPTLTEAFLAELETVPGWFDRPDIFLFDWILRRQSTLEPPGDLAEIGAYHGKSAIVIGLHQRAGERFTVCDLFGGEPADPAQLDPILPGKGPSYRDVTRQAFEMQYLRFHATLPHIVHAPSAELLEHVRPGTHRFVHIDGGHLYDVVRADLAAARAMLRGDGIVVCDDYRADHTPGVAAAVWQAVLEQGLVPICVSASKFYGSFDAHERLSTELLDWLRDHPELRCEVQSVLGRPLIRIFTP